MSIFNKHPKGVWKDKNGILLYPDGMVYTTESDNKYEEGSEVDKKLLKPINNKAEAFEHIKALSAKITSAKKNENLKLEDALEIKRIIQKFGLTESEIDRVLGKENWVNFKEGKGLNFFSGGIH